MNELWLFATSGVDHQCASISETKYSVLAAVVREGSSGELREAGTHQHQEADKHNVRELAGSAPRHRNESAEAGGPEEGRVQRHLPGTQPQDSKRTE